MMRGVCRSCNDRGEILTRNGSIYRFYKRCQDCDAWQKDPYWRKEMGLAPLKKPEATEERDEDGE